MDAHIKLHNYNYYCGNKFISSMTMVKLRIDLVIHNIPAHASPLGSGSHSPFPVQVVELGPISASPGGQLKLKVVPSFGKMPSKAPILGTE